MDSKGISAEILNTSNSGHLDKQAPFTASACNSRMPYCVLDVGNDVVYFFFVTIISCWTIVFNCILHSLFKSVILIGRGEEEADREREKGDKGKGEGDGGGMK